MWYYNNELYHHGVLGMKWGVRKAYHASRAYSYRKKSDAIQKDINSFKGHENGIKTKSGKTVMSKKDVADSIKGLKTVQSRLKVKESHHTRLSKAAAKKDKKSYKAEKIQAKADKRNANYNKYADKLMANRNKRYNKVSQQFDNKISKAGSKGLKNTLSANKTAWQKDFQYGNRMIEYGIKHYNAVNNEYAKTRIDAIYDPSIKKTQRYKLAGKKYINQKWSENGYGKAYATIVAASTYKGN